MDNQVAQAVEPAITRSAGPREVVGISDTSAALEEAIDELLLAGFARCELSVLGKQTGPQANEAANVLADDPAAERTDHFCTEALGNAEGALVSGFAIVPAFGTAAAGAAAGHGGLLLWVRTLTPALEARALAILRRHAGHHVHAHDLPAFR